MTSRKFTILDAMVLVAATAVGLALVQGFLKGEYVGRNKEFLNQEGSWFYLLTQYASLITTRATPCLLAWSLAVGILRLRHPRPRLRHLMRQPGFVASIALAPLLVLFPIGLLLAKLAFPFASFWVLLDSTSSESKGVAGLAVLAAWTTLALSGHWHPEPNWIDRLGRLVGFTWIILSLQNWIIASLGHIFR